MTVHSEDLGAGLHIFAVDERDRTWNGSDQLVGHVIRVHHLGSSGCFGTKNLRNPILFELGLGHLVDDLQNHISLPRHRRTDLQDYGSISGPILTVAKKYFAHFSQIQITDRGVGVDHYSDVDIMALGRERMDKRQAHET